MKIFMTGAAGFIGSALALRLAAEGHEVLGTDALLPSSADAGFARLRRNGFDISSHDFGSAIERSCECHSLYFLRADICDAENIAAIIKTYRPDTVVHLAARPGVRNSLNEPRECLGSNVIGFFNVLDGARMADVSHILYASSSSVYGDSIVTPFNEADACCSPLSVYAATKICDEALAGAYCNAFGMRATGVRMFSVYGPWGRTDMAPVIFADALTAGEPVELFGGGMQTRDFTYIDDIVESLTRLIQVPGKPGESEIYNIGSGRPVSMIEFLKLLERALGINGLHIATEPRIGESKRTFSDNGKLYATTGYRPSTPLRDGLRAFAEWYAQYRPEFYPQQKCSK